MKPLEKNNYKYNEEEFNFKEVLNTLLHYKWSILIITLSVFLYAMITLYFKPNIYSSTSIIEVKSVNGGTNSGGDFLGEAFSGFGTSNVNKDLEILKTYHVNKLVLDKINFHTRYYIDIGLKQVEIYNSIPLDINNITILDNKIVGKKIKVIPVEDGFHLQVENTFKSKILHTLFDKEITTLDNKKIYNYGESIKNAYFELTINKKEISHEPLYFVLLSNNRSIYENIKGNLQITQVNPDAPLINITYTDTIPDRADAYVNAVVESFILQSVAEKSKGSNRLIDFIDKQLIDIKMKLDNSEKELEKYRIENKAINPTLQGATYIKELSNIEIELSKNELKALLIRNLLDFSEKNINAIGPSLMELDDKTTLTLISKLQEAEIEEEVLKSQYSNKHPGLTPVRMRINSIKNKIKLNIKNLASSMSQRNTNLEKLRRTYEKNIESLPTQERVLINLQRDYDVSSETYKYLLRTKSENEMLKVAILSDYRVIDSAYHRWYTYCS